MLLRQNRIVIDLEAIRHNYQALSRAMPQGVQIMPVIKANAYGHGIVEVARALRSQGVNWFGVALVEEGIVLRESGVETEILVLGGVMERAAQEAIHHGLTQTVFDPNRVRALNQMGERLGKAAKVHIKLDTGMGRIGLRTEEEADALAVALKAAKHVRVTGIYTHFADADNPTAEGGMNAFSRAQLKRFVELKGHFDPTIPAHAANSALSLSAPEAGFQMVREGISLYGYPPVATSLPLRHAFRWESEVVHVKKIPKGANIGYGCTFTASRDMRIATVAIGYGDGYHRAASNRAQMLVGGKRANVVGRVCMDQTMIDVTEIEDVSPGSQVVLIGKQGTEEIGADELAAWADTISYEVLLAPTNRVPREYLLVE